MVLVAEIIDGLSSHVDASLLKRWEAASSDISATPELIRMNFVGSKHKSGVNIILFAELVNNKTKLKHVITQTGRYRFASVINDHVIQGLICALRNRYLKLGK